MHLGDLFDADEFIEAIDTGLVSEREHPTEPLVIYNYTKECQYGHFWNRCTTQCRGLIATHDGEIVARPFPKFFNWGEPDAPEIPHNARARVTDKIDGSLGILYRCDKSGISDGYFGGAGYAIATRGSFESEQALVGTEILESYLDGSWIPLQGLTYLFEIVYPENRIVVDYGNTRDLFLLAVINNRTGQNLGIENSGWPGPRAETFEYASLTDAIAAPPRPNREGLVVEVGDVRVKIKQEDYVALHRIVTGLNARVVWEQIGDGLTFEELVAPLPEEFHDWVRDTSTELILQAEKIELEARAAFIGIQSTTRDTGCEWTRKDFALEAQKPVYTEIRPYLFMLLDGKDIHDAIWKSIRPGASAPRSLGDDA